MKSPSTTPQKFPKQGDMTASNELVICGDRIRPFIDSERTVMCYHWAPHRSTHEGVIDDLESRTVVRWSVHLSRNCPS